MADVNELRRSARDKAEYERPGESPLKVREARSREGRELALTGPCTELEPSRCSVKQVKGHSGAPCHCPQRDRWKRQVGASPFEAVVRNQPGAGSWVLRGMNP